MYHLPRQSTAKWMDCLIKTRQ